MNTSYTDEELRIKVAELQGYQNVKFIAGLNVVSADNPDLHDDKRRVFLPNYPASLDAMSLVLAGLHEDDRPVYMQYLDEITHDEAHWSHAWHQLTATARQQALAVVATMEETK